MRSMAVDEEEKVLLQRGQLRSTCDPVLVTNRCFWQIGHARLNSAEQDDEYIVMLVLRCCCCCEEAGRVVAVVDENRLWC